MNLTQQQYLDFIETMNCTREEKDVLAKGVKANDTATKFALFGTMRRKGYSPIGAM